MVLLGLIDLAPVDLAIARLALLRLQGKVAYVAGRLASGGKPVAAMSRRLARRGNQPGEVLCSESSALR